MHNKDAFGSSVTSIGDLDGDLVTDIAVGAFGDDDGGSDTGAVWILFLNNDGTVKNHQEINDISFGGALGSEDAFGLDVEDLGDLDGDGVTDIAVGAWQSNDKGTDKGAVWILFLNADGTLKAHQNISANHGNFTGPLHSNDRLGSSMANLGDLDGDDVIDIAVGVSYDNGENGLNRGAVWILFLNSDGTVKNQ